MLLVRRSKRDLGKGDKLMRLLILGGTQFLGRLLVDAALAQGHEVTLFNRGVTNSGLFPEVEKLRGDRDGNLDALRGHRWDAVIDTSGYVPRIVRESAELLRSWADHYTFVSSISVYADFTTMGLCETDPVEKLEDAQNEDVAAHYGSLKAQCEKEVHERFGEKGLIVRPGLIVGPYDPTGRFSYWIQRFAEGGKVLVPGRKNYPIQFIDGRDLAQWMITMAEKRLKGVFNATGPENGLTMGDFVQTMERIIPNSGKAIWVSEKFLLGQNVREFEELPLWISDKANWPGFMTINAERAVNHGLSFRPLEETILDTLHWEQTRQDHSGYSRQHNSDNGIGLSIEREKQLLNEWRGYLESDELFS